LAYLENIQLTVVIGRQAINWYLKPCSGTTLKRVLTSWKTQLQRLIAQPGDTVLADDRAN
jgi:hypothetical protein